MLKTIPVKSTDKTLSGQTIAILTAGGFNEFEMTELQRALPASGARVDIVSVDAGLINGWNGTGWGHSFPVTHPINAALAADYDALVIPGGERAATKLKNTAHSRRIITGFMLGHKPITALNDGIDVLISAGAIENMAIAGPERYRPLVTAVGGHWADTPTIISNNLLTGMVTPETIKDMIDLIRDHFSDQMPAHLQAA